MVIWKEWEVGLHFCVDWWDRHGGGLNKIRVKFRASEEGCDLIVLWWFSTLF